MPQRGRSIGAYRATTKIPTAEYVDERGEIVASATFRRQQMENGIAHTPTGVTGYECWKCGIRFVAPRGPVECNSCGCLYLSEHAIPLAMSPGIANPKQKIV